MAGGNSTPTKGPALECACADRRLRPAAAIAGLWPLSFAWRGSSLRTMSPVYLIISVYAVMHKAQVRLKADKSSIDIDID
jgi:hypothetical protein